jgi:GntR family transcriptional regulator
MELELDLHSGVPIYRQIIDRVHSARAAGTLKSGDRLPTVRQLAVDLSINPNTVVRAYRELELTGVLTTHQGTGTFVAENKIEQTDAERERKLDQLVAEFVARAGRENFTVKDLRNRLKDFAK